MSNRRAFRHSGKIGDVIYSLPTVRALGGGDYYLRLNSFHPFTESAARAVIPLLEAQPYIGNAATWKQESACIDLDRFRAFAFPGHVNLADYHLRVFGQSEKERDRAWLSVPGPKRESPILFARSLSYRGIPGFWETAYELFGANAAFVGTKTEHDHFQTRVGTISRIETTDLLHLAQVIAGADLLVANQSAPYAVAEGIKLPTIQEVYLPSANCMFGRDSACCVFHWSQLAGLVSFARRFTPDEFIAETAEERALLDLLPPEGFTAYAEGGSGGRYGKLLNARNPAVEVRDPSEYEQVGGRMIFLQTIPASTQEELVSALDEVGPNLKPADLAVIAATNLTVPLTFHPITFQPRRDGPLKRAVTPEQALTTAFRHLYRVRATKNIAVPADGTARGCKTYFALERIPPIQSATAGLLGEPACPGISVVLLASGSGSHNTVNAERLLQTLSGGDELIVVKGGPSAKASSRNCEGTGSTPKPTLKTVFTNRTLGHGANANAGILATRGATIILLTSDFLLRDCALERLRTVLQEPSLAAVGPVSDCMPGTQHIDRYLINSEHNWLTGDQIAEKLRPRASHPPEPTLLLSSRCIALKREALNRAGLFDEPLPGVAADLEFCLRLRSHGYRLAVATDVFAQGTRPKLQNTNPERLQLPQTAVDLIRENLHHLSAPGPIPSLRDLWDIDAFVDPTQDLAANARHNQPRIIRTNTNPPTARSRPLAATKAYGEHK